MCRPKINARLSLMPLALTILIPTVARGGPPLERGWWAKPQSASPAAAKEKIPPNPGRDGGQGATR